MTKHERQNRILERIQTDNGGRVHSTRALAGEFGVSEITIRRDLQDLAGAGLIQRRHGGALRQHSGGNDLRYAGIIMVSYQGKFSNPFFNELLEGADSQLQTLGYHPAFVKTFVEASTADQIQELSSRHSIDGLLILGGLDQKTYQMWRSVTTAIVGTPAAISPDTDAVMLDGEGGMRQMASHLFALGHRRIGFIMGQEYADCVPNRVLGYRAGIAEHGLDDDARLLFESVHTMVRLPSEIGEVGTAKLMSLSQPPDAIMCSSDLIALSALHWLQSRGYDVPGDVAVTGFDNIHEASISFPPLTTVHVHRHYLGRLAAEQLHRRNENPYDPPLRIMTPTRSVIRRSCGAK